MMIPTQSSGRRRLAPIGSLVVCALALLGVGAYGVRSWGSQPPQVGGHRVFYASPDGSSTGDGTTAHPLDLAAAISASSPLLPGDTLWLRGGTYRGTFISELRGTESAPIVVGQLAGERATIDSGSSAIVKPALYVKGAWTVYRDFEVMSSDPTRVLAEEGSQPVSLRRGMGVDVHAPHTRLVNLIVHDLADGIGIWSDAEEAEAYGNIVYHNGWSAGDRAHGHGIYTQNRVGTRRLSDNIIFDQFSHGIHAYGTDAAWVDHITLTGNIVFNNGALDKRYYDRNILLGGARAAVDPVVEENYTYYTPAVRHGGENNLGYTSGCTNLIARNNYFAGQWQGGAPVVLLPSCTGTMTGNVFYGPLEPRIGQAFPDNTYLIERPTGTKVFVRRNKYDTNRTHVVVYNWDRYGELVLDLSEARLDPSQLFELRDAQNILGSPVASGTFGDGRVKVSLRTLSVATPVGDVAPPPHTAPEFAVFVLVGSEARAGSGHFAAAIAAEFRKAWRLLSFTKS